MARKLTAIGRQLSAVSRQSTVVSFFDGECENISLLAFFAKH
jgi:hypothetical protein